MDRLGRPSELRDRTFNARCVCALLFVLGVFAAIRLPALIHMPGGQDEQWFAVPGWTVWQEGIPRIPYVPTRQRDTFFENADVCLMALPPGLFYVQAPFFGLFQAGYPTARIPLFLGGMVTVVLAFCITHRLSRSVFVAFWAAMLMAIGRPLMFTSLTVRPDLLCAVMGWFALLCFMRYVRHQRVQWIVWSGVCSGLAALFHPFALVFAIQIGVGLLFSAGTLRTKVKSYALYSLACGIAVSLWLPLIFAYRYEFQSQFFANVLDRAGPGLPSRLLWPWASIRHHAQLVYEFAGAWQCTSLGILLLAATAWQVRQWFRREYRIAAIGWLALLWSSIYLTAVVAGMHPTKGYWVYPAFWIVILGVTGLADGIQQCVPSKKPNPHQSSRQRELVTTVVFALLLTMSLPGGGFRSALVYYQHWGEPKFHGGKFIAGVLEELPKDGLFLADLSYVFDLYLSGRQTRLCQEKEQYWGDKQIEFSALLLAWEGRDAGWAEQYNARLLKQYGSREPDQACFVDVYVPRP